MENGNDTTDQFAGLGAAALADLRLVQGIMSGLGVTSETIQTAIDAHQTQCYSREPFADLSDEEWATIEPALPLESRQANTMGNRDFVNAVLAAMHRGGRWNDQRKNDPYPDAVRRRFGRWAHLNLWQALDEAIADRDLSGERKAQFKAISDRAKRLQQKN